ncbi:MAG TPA: hypothetical protein VEK07_20010, partial [Polyangiaceae bacterium]|nr:hypothetical protein [Polyangiaceae bacterium]
MRPGATGSSARPSRRRDAQSPSAFRLILTALVQRVRGARGAALVDVEGETVDCTARGDGFVLRVTAAHLRIILEDVRRQRAFHDARFVIFRSGRARFVVYGLPDGYAVVLCLPAGVDLVERCRRPLSDCALRLAREAGWSPRGLEPWHAADVRATERGRPIAIQSAGKWEPIDVLGQLAAGLRASERGWRIRLRSGVEATV